MTIITNQCGGALHPSYIIFMMYCIDVMQKLCTSVNLSKEVIRPQVPLRSPCYDFSLVTYPKFDNAN
jgi:hypothetical protein